MIESSELRLNVSAKRCPRCKKRCRKNDEAIERWSTDLRLLEVLPDEPPPVGGEGDVLEDLAAEGPPTGPIADFVALVDRELGIRGLEIVAGAVAAALFRRCNVTWSDALLSRRAKGIKRYQRPLRYNDGRGLGDGAQEAADELGYLRRHGGRLSPAEVLERQFAEAAEVEIQLVSTLGTVGAKRRPR